MQNIRYFDHAATTAIDNRVLNEMMPYLTENFGNASSMYNIGKINKHARCSLISVFAVFFLLINLPNWCLQL